MSEIMQAVLRMPPELFWTESPIIRAQHDHRRFQAADEIDRLRSEVGRLSVVQKTNDPHDKLIFVGYTNGCQILYANDRSHGGEGAFFKDTDSGCMIPLYMLKTHYHRLETTSFGEVTLERLRKVQQDTTQPQEGEQS